MFRFFQLFCTHVGRQKPFPVSFYKNNNDNIHNHDKDNNNNNGSILTKKHANATVVHGASYEPPPRASSWNYIFRCSCNSLYTAVNQ